MAEITFNTKKSIIKFSYMSWREIPVVAQDATPDSVVALTAYRDGIVQPQKYIVKPGHSLRVPRAKVPQFMSFVSVKSNDAKAYIALQVDLYNDVEVQLVAVDETGAGSPAGGSGRIAGTVKIDGEAKVRDVLIISDERGSRQVLAEEASEADGTFDITYAGWAGPVIALALDAYGQEWAASTPMNLGTIIHPTTLNGYVYEVTSAGTSGAEEPTWTTDSPVQSGNVTLNPRQYYRPVASGPIKAESV